MAKWRELTEQLYIGLLYGERAPLTHHEPALRACWNETEVHPISHMRWCDSGIISLENGALRGDLEHIKCEALIEKMQAQNSSSSFIPTSSSKCDTRFLFFCSTLTLFSTRFWRRAATASGFHSQA